MILDVICLKFGSKFPAVEFENIQVSHNLICHYFVQAGCLADCRLMSSASSSSSMLLFVFVFEH